jgi:hypothetical protein
VSLPAAGHRHAQGDLSGCGKGSCHRPCMSGSSKPSRRGGEPVHRGFLRSFRPPGEPLPGLRAADQRGEGRQGRDPSLHKRVLPPARATPDRYPPWAYRKGWLPAGSILHVGNNRSERGPGGAASSSFRLSTPLQLRLSSAPPWPLSSAPPWPLSSGPSWLRSRRCRGCPPPASSGLPGPRGPAPLPAYGSPE